MNVNAERYATMAMSIPPLDEQHLIADALAHQDNLTRRLVQSIETQLALLAEYREALVTAAVTGEIDVDTFESDRYMERATS